MINLHLGDCMEAMKEMEDNQFDLAIVDPPYGIGASKPSKKPAAVKQRNGSKCGIKQANYAQKYWDFQKSSPEYLAELFRVSRNQIIWGGNYYGLTGGYLVWDKLNGESDQFGCELAWLSFTQRTDLVYYLWSGMFQGIRPSKKVKDALEQIGDKTQNEKRIHPTQKPVKLCKYQLKNYAKEGDKILDTHAGSFSLGIACHDMGFHLEAWEIDSDYHAAATKRFKDHTKQLALFTPQPKVESNQLEI